MITYSAKQSGAIFINVIILQTVTEYLRLYELINKVVNIR